MRVASLYVDLDMQSYRRMPGVNQSRLKLLAHSPHRYNANPPRTSSSLSLGTLAHAFVLEPDTFAREYYVAHESPRRGSKAFAALEGEAGGREIVKPAEYAQLQEMAGAIEAHADAAAILAAAGYTEASAFWCHSNGLALKARFDRLTRDHGIVDLKTTRDASASAFARDAARYGYFYQAAFYRRAVRVLKGADVIPADHSEAFTIVAVETGAAPVAAVYELNPAHVDLEDEQVDDDLATVRRCFDSNHYPCPTDGGTVVLDHPWRSSSDFDLSEIGLENE